MFRREEREHGGAHSFVLGADRGLVSLHLHERGADRAGILRRRLDRGAQCLPVGEHGLMEHVELRARRLDDRADMRLLCVGELNDAEAFLEVRLGAVTPFVRRRALRKRKSRGQRNAEDQY